MSQQKYPKAYEAYQQAVYRDGRNPTFWCSIGVLYYQINQYRDALDAYSRAIRLNPNISEVWYDLGTLYESCNNQTSDALDAYTRAADLDPTNVHIKARLALLKGQPTNGLPNQAGAPLPQDVHPQAYQPGALGGPPGQPWGSQAHNGPPAGPAPPPLATGGNWGGNRIAELQNPPAPPPPLNQYDNRDRMPQPQPPMASRGPSPPRQDTLRPYQEPQRPPPQAHRGLSPSPKNQQSTPYQPAPANLPPQHPAFGTPQGPPQQQLPGQGPPLLFGQGGAPPPPPNGIQPPTSHTPVPGFNRQQQSPRPEVRSIVNNPAPSPGGGFPRTPYEHHPNTSMPQIAGGAPPPSNAQYAADAAARERDERPSSTAPKRIREWEEDQSVKRPATDETRTRLDEIKLQRQSPQPLKVSTPPNRSPSEMRRMDEQRPSSTYHPSEAAHHPPAPPAPQSLPSMQTINQPSPPRMSAAPREEEQRAPPPQPTPVYEPAARKMEIDDNYDDSGDDDKRSTKQESRRGSPKTLNGVPAAPSNGAVEQQS
jgi:glucose repression mediator protein